MCRQLTMVVESLPGDHLLLLVGGITAATQVLIGGGEEVERVVLEVLVDERKENFGKKLDFLFMRRPVCFATGGHGLQVSDELLS